jgi:hypothetical protein
VAYTAIKTVDLKSYTVSAAVYCRLLNEAASNSVTVELRIIG